MTTAVLPTKGGRFFVNVKAFYEKCEGDFYFRLRMMNVLCIPYFNAVNASFMRRMASTMFSSEVA